MTADETELCTEHWWFDTWMQPTPPSAEVVVRDTLMTPEPPTYLQHQRCGRCNARRVIDEGHLYERPLDDS